MESAEPAKMLLQLTKLAQDDTQLRELVLHHPVEELPDQIAGQERFAEFSAVMQRYLDDYGFRCVNELKLEECSLKERPHLVYKVIRNYLLLDNPAVLDGEAIAAREQEIRRNAEEHAFAAVSRARSLWPRKTHPAMGVGTNSTRSEESRKHAIRANPHLRSAAANASRPWWPLRRGANPRQRR